MYISGVHSQSADDQQRKMFSWNFSLWDIPQDKVHTYIHNIMTFICNWQYKQNTRWVHWQYFYCWFKTTMKCMYILMYIHYMLLLLLLLLFREEEIVLPSERAGAVKENYQWKVSRHRKKEQKIRKNVLICCMHNILTTTCVALFSVCVLITYVCNTNYISWSIP